MGDLTVVIMAQCKSCSETTANVNGYEQTGLGSELTWPRCTCPAYKFSKATINFGGRLVKPACKHINQAMREKCGWHQLTGVSQIEEGICPECGGETEYIRVGV